MNNSIEAFRKRWEKKAEEIKRQSFDAGQCDYIKNIFSIEVLNLLQVSRGIHLDPGASEKIDEIRSDVYIALQIAHSNYRKEKRGFLSKLAEKVFGGKKFDIRV